MSALDSITWTAWGAGQYSGMGPGPAATRERYDLTMMSNGEWWLTLDNDETTRHASRDAAMHAATTNG